MDSLDHEWVSEYCLHREHQDCPARCPLCASECLCVCHRWAIPLHGQPIVYH